MRLEQLLYITEIAKTGSIANTAERLYVSSPSISLAIKSLEEELGVKLFERSRMGLDPTETGKKLITSAQGILNQIEEFKQEAKSDSHDIEGHLVISAVPAICRYILPKVVTEFHSKNPNVTFQIKESQNLLVRKDVLNGEADIGLIFSIKSSPEENQLLTTTHLLDTSAMVCFNKNVELANQDHINITDLQKYPVAFTLNINDTKAYHSHVFGTSYKPNILISHNPETKKQFILQGLAIGFESLLTIQSDPFYKHEDIAVKPLVGLEAKISYHYIKLKNRYFSIAGKEFLKALHKYTSSYEDKYFTTLL